MAKKSNLTSFIGGVVDKMSYLTIAVLIVILLLLSSFYFWYFNPYDQGTNCKELSSLNALYFSIVTFATLGYGDISPIGFGRVVASIEVLSGLFLSAIFIGKIASERQYAMLRLIYTSEHQRRLVELEKEIESLNYKLNIALTEHNHNKLFSLSKELCRFVSGVNNYLNFQSKKGDLASAGNNSTFRGFYETVIKLQKTIYDVVRTFGVEERTINQLEQVIAVLNNMSTSMKGFHSDDSRIFALLDEINDAKLKYENWKENLKKGNSKHLYKNDLSEYLLNRVSQKLSEHKWSKDIDKIIAGELGIQNNLSRKCIDKILNYSKPEI